jgi:hypothetical protein
VRVPDGGREDHLHGPADCRVAEMAVEREDKVKAWCVEVPRF